MHRCILAAFLLFAAGVFTETFGQTSAPQISGVAPTTARAGDQIVITGSNFGSSQGSVNVWLGSAYGIVVSWSDSQVIAAVASGSQTGVAQILQGGVWSNPVNLTVITPSITTVTPTTAIAGTQITVTGSGFGANQGSGNVWLGSTYGLVVTWSDTQVVANVASGSKSGVAQILQGGVWSNTVNLTVSTPNITSVSPTIAIAGTQITITGSGFGANQGSGNVWLGSTYGVVVSWSDTQVVANVASGSKSGVAQILQGGVWSNTVNLTVSTPNITSVSPTTAIAGTQITITGSGFGANQGSGNVWLGSTYGVVVSWSDAQVVANVASGSKSGVAQILQGGVWSNTVNLTVSTPNITSVTPTTGIAGTQITITGTGFGASQGSGNVWLGSTYGVVVSWSDTQVMANVASGSSSGVAQVLQGGVWSNSVNLTVVTPNITGVSPASGNAGTQVTITGTGFGATQGAGNVWLGSTYGIVVSWSDTQVVATVASGSNTGVAQILQGGVWSNSVNFAVTSLNLASLTPGSAPVGALVTITGSGFGAVQGGSSVNFNGTPAAITSWSDTRIVAVVSNITTTGPVSVAVGGVASNSLNFTVTTTPSITDVSPNSGAPGTQVSVTGSGFGSVQGGGTVLLGSKFGTVVSWSDTNILATVATGSMSGSAQVRQGGVVSNSLSFTVSAATIASVSPTSGASGTQVTISGSGFGSAQGSGQVWLGTALAQVVSWSDSQVVATVAAGSATGIAQILQNGVWSNSVTFTVTGGPPNITSISPNAGSAGTVVTFQGNGFGSSQGSGIAWIGATQATVNSWGDSQVSATVPAGAVSGVAKIQQNGLWSNAVTFTVPPSSGSQLTLNPNVINMLVGDTRSIQALAANSQPVTGLTWASSDTTIVTLSTDDPPILTAIAPGNITITAGSASADVTVGGSVVLPPGTVVWSDPGDGSGVTGIVPGVPSPTGVADVFGAQADCNVQAITTDGSVAWASPLGQKVGGRGCKNFLADFQGGLVAVDPGFTTIVLNSDQVPTPVPTAGSVQKLDGITGQPYGAYSIAYPRITSRGQPTSVAVHTDGTIFAIDGDSLVAIDPATGNKKSSHPMHHSICQNQSSPSDNLPTLDSQLMIAGDGYAYLVYDYTLGSGQYSCQPDCFPGGGCVVDAGHIESHGRLVRMGTGGDSSEIDIGDASEDWNVTGTTNPFTNTVAQAGQIPQYEGTQILITNADQGVLLSLYAPTTSYCAVVQFLGFDANGFPIYNNSGCVDGTFNTQLVATSGSSVVSQVTLPADITYVEPDLQAQDGTYFGIVDYESDPFDYLAKFDATGNIQWSVPNFYAQMATSDGGLVAQSGDGSSNVTFDSNGNATGQLASFPTQSWLENAYQTGSVDQVAFPLLVPASTFAAMTNGNASLNGTAIQQVQTNQPQGPAKQLPALIPPVSCLPIPGSGVVIPTCGNVNAIELLGNQSPDTIFKQYVQTFAPAADTPQKPNSVMFFDDPQNPGAPINVTGPGQVLQITLRGLNGKAQNPFSVETERVDLANLVLSVVTLQGHPLAGWRYWRVYSIGTTSDGKNDVVIETGAYDEPGPGPKNYAGYYKARGDIVAGWAEYLRFIQRALNAPQGSNLHNTLGGTQIINYFPGQWEPPTLVDGYWDYAGFLTDYILNNVCQSTSCN